MQPLLLNHVSYLLFFLICCVCLACLTCFIEVDQSNVRQCNLSEYLFPSWLYLVAITGNLYIASNAWFEGHSDGVEFIGGT